MFIHLFIYLIELFFVNLLVVEMLVKREIFEVEDKVTKGNKRGGINKQKNQLISSLIGLFHTRHIFSVLAVIYCF